ncbi:hypothetical protein [Bacterioplanoides sp.]|uniref:hypothetical protein n=1 Tax=Bacterioplanoides sp. TaxID=2066072 RepID=UPI003B00E28F
MIVDQIDYLKSILDTHIRFHFTEEAVAAYEETEIIWLDINEIKDGARFKPGTILVPITTDQVCDNLWTERFGSTNITLWGKLPRICKEWQACSDGSPFWYSNGKGVFMVAWKMAVIIFDLVTLREEVLSTLRDSHGRFVGEMSPRDNKGQLDIPVFNNAAAILVDRCLRIKRSEIYELISLVKPMNLVLSHDLDQLRGDDFFTQFSRFGRMLRPLSKMKFPDLSQLKFIISNIFFPKKVYLNDLLKMLDAEKEYGYRSILYILCGDKGRYGARTSSKHFERYLKLVPKEFPLGIHYNYNTHLDEKKFQAQKKEVEKLAGYEVKIGRAHYLRMDPDNSFRFWARQGVTLDESLGYPDRIGYRAGVAGFFFPFDQERQGSVPIVSLPLVAMDSCLGDRYGEEALEEVKKHIDHLSVVGGTFTLLFHPGSFHSEEFKSTKYLYQNILKYCNKKDARNIVPGEFLEFINNLGIE